MNRKRLLVIGALALAAGALSSLFLYKQLQARMVFSRAEVEVIVAANDIHVGAKIGDHDLKVVKYPPENLPPHVFHTKTSLMGRGAILPIEKGEFLLPDKLAAQGGGAGLSALVATGMRAVAVRVNDVTSVDSFVVPGTRVDVIATSNATGAGERWTITLLQNVAVLASGQKTDRNTGGEPRSATVVTLLVSPADAQKLALANQEAHIQFSLRNLLDNGQEKPPALTRTTLFEDLLSKRPVRLVRAQHPLTEPAEPDIDIDILRGRQKETIRLKQ